MKKNNMLKIFAVVIAVIIWFLINLLKEQTTTINLPIRILNVPENIFIFENEEARASVMVHGTGINILLFYLREASIDYNGSDFVMGNNVIDIERLNSSLPKNKNLSFTAINTDNPIVINTYRILQKRIPVFFDFNSENDKQMFLENNYNFDDIYITISGPSVEIQRIDNIFTEKIGSDILRQRNKNIRFRSINENIVVIPPFIELEQVPDIIATRTLTAIPIVFDRDDISIFPERVSVIIEGKQDLINQLSAEEIIAFILEHDLNETMELNVNFSVPDFVKIIDYTPMKVSVVK